MRHKCLGLIMLYAVVCAGAQDTTEGPTNEKAKKTFQEGKEYSRREMYGPATDAFKKADKQDGGQCKVCKDKVIEYGMRAGDWKSVEMAAGELAEQAQGAKNIALAHYRFGIVLRTEALAKHNEEILSRAHEEMGKALAAAANFPDALFADGQILAILKQDDAAKTQFERFERIASTTDPNRQRALRYISRPELARSRLAPAFEVTTAAGQHLSLDGLEGKVVLVDFWATWCAPCREALLHIKDIAAKFQGQPLVILSISLDKDKEKWKEFTEKNQMTWPQYWDGSFEGPMATLFEVNAIPHTFTIDAEGILRDEHIGDEGIEGKLRKLVALAREAKPAEKASQ